MYSGPDLDSEMAITHSFTKKVQSMIEESSSNLSSDKKVLLPNNPPFIWPEALWHTKDGTYEYHPPFDFFLLDADMVNVVIVGTRNGTVEWVHTLMQKDGAL